MYTVDYFIKKFEAIPEEKWLIRDQGLGDSHCAIGWCKNRLGNYGDSSANKDTHFRDWYSEEANGLHLLFKGHGIISVSLGDQDCSGWNVADVNNGDHPYYQQPTPKQRILAALYDIKNIQEEEIGKSEIKTEQTFIPVSYTKVIDEILVSAQ